MRPGRPGGATCQQFGFYEQNGPLTCSPDCTLDLTPCQLNCGDTIVSAIHGEDCEGTDPGGQTCQGLGLGAGTLACNPATCRYDLSGCEIQAVCGDGTITLPEQCEGADLGGQTCESLGYHGGDLACRLDCTFDLVSCESFGRCGDGVVDEAAGEECDGGNLDGQTCQTQGFYGGTLACAGCRFELTDCESWGRCGDDVVQVGFGEECDGALLGDRTCESLGYHAGELACAEDCRALDTGACEAAGRCGDGVVQGGFGEVCDGEALDGQSCLTLGWYGGTLACEAGCEGFDAAGCATVGRCGDGVMQAGFGEVCDGDALDGQTCVTQGWYGGTLACGGDCAHFDATGCASAGRCGDGIIQAAAGEECDGANLGGQTCLDLEAVRVNGTLACGNDCRFDRSGCSLVTMVGIPGGTFHRDSDPFNVSTVSAFRLARTEITRALFQVVMGVDPSYAPFSSGSLDPVQQVSWYDAIAFCNKASLLEGLTPVYSVAGVDFATLTYAEIPTVLNDEWNNVVADWNADGYRLPTEMEWIWAALGAEDDYTKPFSGSDGGNFIGDYAVFGNAWSEPGRTLTQRSNLVGSKLPNELGLYDLSGNVNEWVWDRYFNMLPTGPLVDYRGPTEPAYTARPIHGGDWSQWASYCAPVWRSAQEVYARITVTGIRVVRRM